MPGESPDWRRRRRSAQTIQAIRGPATATITAIAIRRSRIGYVRASLNASSSTGSDSTSSPLGSTTVSGGRSNSG